MIEVKDVKLSLWYPIKEERKPIIKKRISRILNELLYPHLFNSKIKFTDEEIKEIVMNLRQNLSKELEAIEERCVCAYSLWMGSSSLPLFHQRRKNEF